MSRLGDAPGRIRPVERSSEGPHDGDRTARSEAVTITSSVFWVPLGLVSTWLLADFLYSRVVAFRMAGWVSSFRRAAAIVAEVAEPFEVEEMSIGGGLGVPYVADERAPSINEWGEAIVGACREAGVTARVTAEPGRSIVAAAAVTLYEVGTIKDIPGVRTYVSVDGGMSDNPRPVLYGSGYETFLPRAVDADRPRTVTVVGKHCESGDVLVRDATVAADLAVGDILGTAVTGAYGHSMGSNYNKVLRPPVVFASGGDARLVVRREPYDDLVRLEV